MRRPRDTGRSRQEGAEDTWVVGRCLLRAPLLDVGALRAPARALAAHALGDTAVALASPDLARALGRRRSDGAARAALERYGARAAFRPTPHGLLAGVAVAELGERTA